VGLGYAGSVVLSDDAVKNALGRRSKLHAALIVAQDKWRNLPLSLKLLVVVILIASQLSLHSLLIIFPIAFLWCPWCGNCGSELAISWSASGTGSGTATSIVRPPA